MSLTNFETAAKEIGIPLMDYREWSDRENNAGFVLGTEDFMEDEDAGEYHLPLPNKDNPKGGDVWINLSELAEKHGLMIEPYDAGTLIIVDAYR